MDEDLDQGAKAYLAWAEGLSSEELDAEIALLEAHEARIAKDLRRSGVAETDVPGFLFCTRPHPGWSDTTTSS
ncbi:hypothetical protein [Streptomyces sp. NPDC056105]|uniref:hypothetical protein n=1 Tax=Streptomyces sp. NPDC056105 TaxID=3345714 RepID=UPI0035DAD8ED